MMKQLVAQCFVKVMFCDSKGMSMPFDSSWPWSRRTRTAAKLFDGDSAMFEGLVSGAVAYGEYGMGLSTLYVVENSHAPVYSVDTSTEWTERIRAEVPHTGERDISLERIDLGPLGDWGTPLGYSHRRNIPKYLGSPWTHDTSPDLVLVDGRFRVACTAFSLLQGQPGTVIVVDDYADRPEYFVVEELVPVSDRCGRQVMFVVPEAFDRHLGEQLVSDFMHVRE